MIRKLIHGLKRAYFLGKLVKVASLKRKKIFFHNDSTSFVD